MNLAAFAVIVAQERARPGDRRRHLRPAGLGATKPWLAWPMTIAMLALAGIPGTVGFIGKFQLIHALVDGDYTWLAIVLVIGSMISLGYYLRVVAAMWMRSSERHRAPARRAGARPDRRRLAGGRRGARVPEGRRGRAPSPASAVMIVAVGFAAATIVFGIFPSPLFDFVAHAGHALSGLF